MAENTKEINIVLNKRKIEESKDDNDVQQPVCKKAKIDSSANIKLDKNKCRVWLRKKRRQCKHDLVSGTKYCRFHLETNTPADIQKKSIQCSYCKTLIFQKKGKQNNEANLSGHYKRCPVKLKLEKIKSQPFYTENIYFYGDYDNKEQELKQNDAKTQFTEKLKQIYSCLTLTPVNDESNNSSFNAIRDIYFKVHKNKENLKHCSQIESIIYNMDKHCNLNKDKQEKPLILELGGGKASFGSMLHYFYNEESKFVIIDINSNFRHKEDNRLENLNNICRIQCGLQHCEMSKIKHINDNKRRIFVISKHLCGAATDFGLRAVLNDKYIKNMNIGVVAIALCCRGKCSLETYCNVNYLKSIGVEQNKFDLIRKMTTWEIDGNKNDKGHMEIGKICRRLIDEGRVQFLKQNGFDNVKLVKYVDANVTKENVLLLASRN
eukprot:286899_1